MSPSPSSSPVLKRPERAGQRQDRKAVRKRLPAGLSPNQAVLKRTAKAGTVPEGRRHALPGPLESRREARGRVEDGKGRPRISPDRHTRGEGGKGRRGDPTHTGKVGKKKRGQGTTDSEVYSLGGSVAGELLVKKANALTLFFVIVFPGLAVVGLAALRLALLAWAKNTKAVRPLGSRGLGPQPAGCRPCSLHSLPCPCGPGSGGAVRSQADPQEGLHSGRRGWGWQTAAPQGRPAGRASTPFSRGLWAATSRAPGARVLSAAPWIGLQTDKESKWR